MKTFDVEVKLHGTTLYEDPHCPSQWRGSGCYVIEAPAFCRAYLTVNAESEDEAGWLAADYEYEGEQNCELESISEAEIREVSLQGDCNPGGQNEGVVEVSFSDVEAKEQYEPDPDDY